MKYLFKEGEFIDVDGKKELNFYSGVDYDADTSLYQSLNEITSESSKNNPIIKEMNKLDSKPSKSIVDMINNGEFDDKFREIKEGEVGRDIQEPFELTEENVQKKLESYSKTLDLLADLMPNEFSRKLSK